MLDLVFIDSQWAQGGGVSEFSQSAGRSERRRAQVAVPLASCWDTDVLVLNRFVHVGVCNWNWDGWLCSGCGGETDLEEPRRLCLVGRGRCWNWTPRSRSEAKPVVLVCEAYYCKRCFCWSTKVQGVFLTCTFCFLNKFCQKGAIKVKFDHRWEPRMRIFSPIFNQFGYSTE